MTAALAAFSRWLVPALFLLIPFYAWRRGVPLYSCFAEGALFGLKTALSILPPLLTMLLALHIFRDCGAFALLARLLSPLTEALGVPADLLPLALMRPLSGSGALGITAEIFAEHGPDSLIGRMASVMQGSTDTTFYVLTVYFGSVGVKNYRHALFLGLSADLVSFLSAVLICRLLFA